MPGCGSAAGSGVTGGRDVFASTADAEVWLVDRDDPLLDRADPYARRVFRDTHPLDNDADAAASTTATASGSCSAAWA